MTYHTQDEIKQIQEAYLFLVFIWSIIVVILGSITQHIYSLIILFLPYILFGFAYLYACDITIELEENLFASRVFTIIIFVTIPLLIRADNVKSSRTQYMLPMLLALFFSVLSVISVWVPPKWLLMVKHLQTGFEVMALTLVIFSLFTFFAEMQRLTPT